MILRAVTGACIVGSILAAIWHGTLLFQSLWIFLMAVGFYEAGSMCPVPSMKRAFISSALVWIITCAFFVINGSAATLGGGVLFSLFLFFSLGIMDFEEIRKKGCFADFSTSFVLFFYVGGFYTPMLYIASAYAPAKGWIFLLFLIMWLQDTFAYLGGRLLGKRPLSRELSPKKTWEGSLIGLLCACAAIGYIHEWFPTPGPMPLVLLVFIVGLAGQAGDLMESFLKRCFEVKDSGKIFPGHGGVLDRFDSVVAGSLIFLTIMMPEFL